MISKFAILSLGLIVAAGSGAHATPVFFTWNPGASGVGLKDGTAPAPSVKADNMVVADYASATITDVGPGAGNFTEKGALVLTQFENGTTGVPAPGLDAASHGYGLYYTFTAMGNEGGAPPPVGGTVSGPITSIVYTLWADPQGEPTVTVHNGGVTITHNTGAFALATGSGGGTVADGDFVTLSHTKQGFSPSAHAITAFDECAGVRPGCTGNESAFFVSPSPFDLSVLEASFTNTLGVSTLSTVGITSFLNINGGGGNLDFLRVPEPTALAVLAVGLLGLGLVRRR